VAIFIGMQRLTNADDLKKIEKEDVPQLVYLRDTKDSVVMKKKRVQPKKPKIQKIKKVNLQQPKMKMKIQKSVKIQPIITKNINLSSISSLTGAKIDVNIGLIDANTLRTISKVYPKFPRRAKLQRKEGFVQVQFQIDLNGYVHNPIITKSKPKGLFEKSALRAIKKWRFKPIKNSDQNALVDASITFNYRLSK